MKKYYIFLLLLCSQIATAFPTVTEINPAINSLMKQVNIDSLEYYIRYLQDLGPRPRPCNYPGYLNNVAAKNWLHQQYIDIGNLDVYDNHFLLKSQCDTIYIENYPGSGQFYIHLRDSAMNVVAIQKGTEYPDEYIIVSSHFDSVWESPGADDNASGTAGVMEIARILSSHSFKRSIIYLNNNNEELGVGTLGSIIFAYCCRSNSINILGVFNLDMIGYAPIDKPLRIFYNDRAQISKEFAQYFDEVANLYLPDIPSLPNASYGENGAGDAASFVKNNYPAMYIGDLLDTFDPKFPAPPCYHSSCDTIGIGKVDAGVNSMELVKGYTQATLAAIAELAELSDDYIKEETSISCAISPNPANSTVAIILYLKDAGNLTVTLNNMLGQEIVELHNAFTDAGKLVKRYVLFENHTQWKCGNKESD
jgi:hypothetical protein